jgi:hypothetical protein
MKGQQAIEFLQNILAVHVPEMTLEQTQCSGFAEDKLGHSKTEVMLSSPHGKRLALISFMTTVRLPDLLGRMALAALQYGKHRNELLDRPILFLGAKLLGAKSISTVQEFMNQHLPTWEWGLFDQRGMLRLHIPSMKLEVMETPVPLKEAAVSRKNSELFTDLNRWMIKILLLHNMGDKLWGGPRAAVGTATDLHRIAKVSVETAHRFVRTFEERGFVRRTSKGLCLSRAEEMLEAWVAREQLAPRKRTPAAWFLDQPPELSKAVFPISKGVTVVAGGFEACQRLGVLHATPGTLELHVAGDWKKDSEKWAMQPCKPENADLFLVETSYPSSVIRGQVPTSDLATVDVLQAALDVVHSPARGLEQVQFLVDLILSSLAVEER